MSEKIDNPCKMNGCPNSARSTGSICGDCSRAGLGKLKVLPERHRQLREALVPKGGARDERISQPKPGSRPPVNMAAFGVLGDLCDWVITTDAMARDITSSPKRDYPKMRSRVILDGLVHLLDGQHWHRIMLDARAPQTLHGLDRLTVRIDKVLGLDRLVHRLPAPCPSCGLITLQRKDGGEVVTCATCGSSWPERLYRHLTRVLAEEVLAGGGITKGGVASSTPQTRPPAARAPSQGGDVDRGGVASSTPANPSAASPRAQPSPEEGGVANHQGGVANQPLDRPADRAPAQPAQPGHQGGVANQEGGVASGGGGSRIGRPPSPADRAPQPRMGGGGRVIRDTRNDPGDIPSDGARHQGGVANQEGGVALHTSSAMDTSAESSAMVTRDARGA